MMPSHVKDNNAIDKTVSRFAVQ